MLAGLRVLTARPRCVPDEFDRAFELASGEPEGEETMAGRHVELFGGERTSTMFPVIDQREKLSGLLEDPRICGLLSALLGDDFNYAGGDGHHYIGDTVSLPPLRCLAQTLVACRVVSAAHSPCRRCAKSWHPDEEAGIWGSAFSTTAGDADPDDRVCFALKLAFYLDPLSKDTGCLSVVPGI